MFIEVESIERGCKVIINLDTILEIAPLREGGCTLFFPDSAAVGGKNSMKIKDSYSMFKQFVLQTVSEEDVARQVARLSGIQKEPNDTVMDRIAKMQQQAVDEEERKKEEYKERKRMEQARRRDKLRMSEEEKKAIRDEIKDAVLQAAQAAGAGNLPGGVKRMIKDLTEPQISWKELLEQQIQSTIKSDYTFARPSRKGWGIDAILPATKPGETIDIFIGIDTSGSIGPEELKIFFSEIRGIMDSYTEYKIKVVGWDTAIGGVGEFTSENMEDITTFDPKGGGGTDPHCVWEYMIEEGIEPKKLIMFTDYCFFGWSPETVESYCDTVWIIKGNPSAEPEFGIWAHYEEVK